MKGIMGTLDAALELAKQGFYVFPLPENEKKEPPKNFYNVATRDEQQIREFWTRVDGEIQNYNVGISTTSFGEDDRLVAVDIDCKKGKKGEDTIFELDLDGKSLPETFEQITPTGGRHLVYKTKRALSQSPLGKDVDIRAFHGYILGAGSSIDGKLYAANGKPVANAPEWLENTLSEVAPKVGGDSIEPPKIINQESARKRAEHYLKAVAPLAVQDESGDATTFRVAAAVKDFGLQFQTTIELMCELWNPRCSPPWDEADLEDKVLHAYQYGKKQIGASAPELDFDEIETPKTPLELLNDEYAVINIKGRVAVLWEGVDHKDLDIWSLMDLASFKLKLLPHKIRVGESSKQIADVWLRWSRRREFKGLVFEPGRKLASDYYNIWRGFTCEPLAYNEASAKQKRGLDLFQDHILNNVCSGDQALAEWLTGYFAHLIQRPWEKPLTTLVFRGSQGTGKSALVNQIGKLLGMNHFSSIDGTDQLSKNFNAQMEGCLLMVMEEAFWAGDKKIESRLKSLTTSTKIMIEKKGIDAYMMDSYLRLVMTSNEDWVVPASYDDRRYAIFSFGEGRKKDLKYFQEMTRCLDEEKGNRVLLDYLQKFDLSRVNVNQAPKTEAQLDQKLLSLGYVATFWHECLSEGQIAFAEFTSEWVLEATKAVVRNAFKAYLKDRNMNPRFLPNDSQFGKQLKQCCPSVITDQKVKADGRYSRSFRFPTLEVARAEFEKFIGHEVKWT